MPIPTQGPISFSDIQKEFGGTGPISIEDYVRGGAFVPMTPNAKVNNNIPTTTIDLSALDFRGSAKRAVVSYALYAGGGAGGFGVQDKGEGFRGTYGDRGGLSRISGSTISTITAVGGQGGENCALGRGANGGNGQGTDRGPGGQGGGEDAAGGNAPATSYGAGGGGGGGDDGSLFDSGGCAGEGGRATIKYTGFFNIVYGNSVNITIGTGGTGSNNRYDIDGNLVATGGGNQPGGSGASGFCSLIYDDVVRNISTSQSLIID